MTTAACCFVSPVALRPYKPFVSSSSFPCLSLSNRHHRVHLPSTRVITSMSTDNINGDKQDKLDSPPPAQKIISNDNESKQDDDDDESGVSFWGVTSFAIIFVIFAIGIVATLARDFIPGGVSAPVS